MNKKGKNINRLGSIALSASILTYGFLPSVGYASEPTGISEEVENSISDESTNIDSNGLERGTVQVTGTLNGSNPFGLKPRATAKTSTNKNVSSIRVKLDSNNNGTSVSSSGWKTLQDTTLVNSGQLVSNTESTRFTGYHQIKQKSTSDWFSGKNTTVSF